MFFLSAIVNLDIDCDCQNTNIFHITFSSYLRGEIVLCVPERFKKDRFARLALVKEASLATEVSGEKLLSPTL